MGASSKEKWPVSHASPMKCLCCVALSGSFSFREEPQVTGWPYHVFQDAITMAFMKYPSIKNNGIIHKTQMQHVLISPESRLKSDERDIQHKKFFFSRHGHYAQDKKPLLGQQKGKPQKCGDPMALCMEVTSEKQN